MAQTSTDISNRCRRATTIQGSTYWPSPQPILIANLLKPVARLERAAVDPGLVRIDSGVATCPTEKQGWPQRENNGLAVDVGLNVYALGGGRQSEVQPFSKDDGVRLVDDVTHHGVEYFRLQQKCCGVGPVAGRHPDQLLTLREMIRFNFGERTRSGNARSSGVPQLIAGARVERGGS